MDAVTEFMEECYDFVMFEQRRFGGGRLAEIADECSSRIATSSIRIEIARLEGEVGCVTVFTWTRVEVQIEVADEGSSFAFVVPDGEDFDVFVPSDIFPLACFCRY